MNKFKSSSAPYLLSMGLLFGVNTVVSRAAISGIPPMTFIAIRFIISIVGFVILIAVVPGLKWSRDPAIWRKAAVLGVLGMTIPMISFINALLYQSSGVVSLFQTTSPALIIILAHFFLPDERLTWGKGIGVIVAFVGAALILMSGETGLPTLSADWRGYFWVLLGVFSVSIASIYTRRYLKDTDDIQITSIQIIIASVICVPIALFTDHYSLGNFNWGDWGVMIYIGLVGTLLSFLLNFYIVRRFGATVSSQASYIILVVATLLGVIFLDEIVSPLIFLSMGLIFAGLTLFNLSTNAVDAPTAH